ncbi:nucleotidyl transferase AbiEii/AbiGii toxin family protein (plasmid) [Rhizobium sp. B230/85]|uniref:nucleotidyl transferase AbiEii/AbiGii toxin family protein n=1 Tax=unclassified Rhizobium TaxID=2613769 RepID=UPI001ADB35D1|nr:MULTISPECIES: nucleotidyl transferase AbiEii/AbiGii toxin family protein [unclassified Rhizobium]MBO9135917.1 nucleotidyl transferase AbiEii/AbiGii toxin family protein [Rhizobium sp. B209b/85]QXZ99342.1 nucleotidyl transferase AbiEii/AbiGii toxin family protein [Rhizobium sp. B230/85]
MTDFQRPEHRIIAKALRLMDPTLLLLNRCWFAGGTAVVMMHGEYRRSLDVDFLCADMDGYRAMRSLAVEKGVGGLFAAPVTALREVRADQYGVRTLLSLDEQTIRFEIVRESRIPLDGIMNAGLGVPVLLPSDMMAEKLLANADRCQDRAVAYRDAIDLGMLIDHHGAISQDAVTKAENAYGGDIGRKALWVVDRLADRVELQHVCDALQMKREDAARAMSALSREVLRFWHRS